MKVVVPYPTLLESYSLVMRELGIRTAREFLEEVVRGSIFENASSEDYQKASLRVLRHKDRDITLVDAVIAEVADRLDAPVWTFDHHFDVMGANVWR
jgi:predicted nucleic acid-binding protein